MKPHIVIISPYLAKANNGNWFTASRWARFLRKQYRVTLALEWDGTHCDAMIALHARRSADAIKAFSSAQAASPLIVVLTGTDLYRDIHSDVSAQHSLQLATHLVVLQPEGLKELTVSMRNKASVIYQSASSLKPLGQKAKARYFDVTMIGHLRDEKDPVTFMRAATQIKSPHVRLIHIGGALDPLLGAQAEAAHSDYHEYRWLGQLPHTETRQRLKRSHLMVIASVMEGGAHVIIEAVTSGVPVLASDISGNRGMLGADYAGYFPLGDSLKLARLIDKAASDEAFYRLLQSQCNVRAPLFAPVQESTALLQLVNNCIQPTLA